MIDATTFWLSVAFLGAGTFLLRYGLLGLLSDRRPSARARRALGFVPIAVLPAIAAPLLATDAQDRLILDPLALVAASVTILVGVWSRNVLATIGAGVATILIARAATAVIAF